jgi:streptogramin lyase
VIRDLAKTASFDGLLGGVSLFLYLLVATNSALADTRSGRVTDSSGKPLRGALVTLTIGKKTIARFAQDDGSYQFSNAPGGKANLSAEAYGFAVKQSRDVETNVLDFQLSPRWNVARLTSAEWETTLPDNDTTRFITATCTGCHGISRPANKPGLTADDWEQFLPQMGTNSMFQVIFPSRAPYWGAVLEKTFGSGAEPPTIGQVKHVEPSEATLKATFMEYAPPTHAMIHSIAVDTKRDLVWFAEYDYNSNKIGRFKIEDESFAEYDIHSPKSLPHTPVIDREGRVWTPANNVNILIETGPDSSKLVEHPYPPVPESETMERKGGIVGGHNSALDKDGNVWFTGGISNFIEKFDPKTQSFERFHVYVADKAPAESMARRQMIPGQPEPKGPVLGTSYDLAFDSKGVLWYSQLWTGTLVRFDPRTNQTTPFKFPSVISIRGIMVDPDDNIWFGNFHGHKLVKYDQKTGKLFEYQPPTQAATVYGLVYDRQRHLVWYADMNGNNISSFDPKTEKFVEYPIPTLDSNPRFISLDGKGRIWYTHFFGSGKIGVLDPGDHG